MTSTNDGKDVKSNQSSGPKGKTYYIELYKTLDSRLTGEGDVRERTRHLCEAWRRVHCLCQHSAATTHPHLLSWLHKHTARVILQTEWQSPSCKDAHTSLDNALNDLIEECKSATARRDGISPSWEQQLQQRADWFKRNLENPWGHPVLKVLLDPRGQRPTNDEILKWLKEERGVMLVTRLRQLATSKCDDLATALVTAVMDQVRATTLLVRDNEQPEHYTDKPTESKGEPTFADILKTEADFTTDVWDLLTDIEFVLLHKSDRVSKCIELAKQTPLLNGYPLVERLQARLESSPREKKLWKNAKEVAILIAQVIIARCMVVPVCAGGARTALYWCARALARLLGGARLPPAAATLAAPAATARHLHTLASAVDTQCTTELKPFVCELYVRAITAGMNELERFKLTTEKDSEARSTEQTLCTWFTQLGILLAASDRIKCECTLTAFSVHPSPTMYEKIKSAPILPPVAVPDDQDLKQETTSEFGSWATDSHTQTNLVKTSETLNIKHTRNQANVLSTAILTEGEALGLSPELCQDIAVLLSGPRVKTLSWDMDRERLLENCRTYMERTHGGTKALTTELKYLNLDPSSYQHLPLEEEDENDVYYGIEKGYEHLVELQEQEEVLWETAIFDPEMTESASSGLESEFGKVSRKKKNKKLVLSSDEEETDPLSIVAENKKNDKKKERPHSKERSSKESGSKEKKERKKKTKPTEDSEDNKERRKSPKPKVKSEALDKEKKKEKKPRKKKVKEEKEQVPVETKPGSLSSLIGMKVAKIKIPEGKYKKKTETKVTPCITDSDYDSQGKSSLASLNSEGNDPDVLFDGLFSMEDYKSPDKNDPPSKRNSFSSGEVSFANGQVAVHSQHPYKQYDVKSSLPQDRQASPSQTLESSPNTGSSQSIREEVKRSLSKLLEFRRQKNLLASQKALNHSASSQNNTPKLPNTSNSRLTGTIIQQPLPEQTKTHPKTMEFFDGHEAYMNKKQVEQLNDLKTEVDNYLKTKFSSKPVIQYASKQNVDKTHQNITPVMRHEHVQPSTYQDVNIAQTNQQINIAGVSYPLQSPPTPNVAQNQRHQASLDSASQKNFQDFLRELHETINAGTGSKKDKTTKPSAKKSNKPEIKPMSAVPPIIPSATNKEASSQCAKTLQGKKVETQLNTFSRLSYMHKNKQYAESVIGQYDKNLINRYIEEQRLAKSKHIQSKGESKHTQSKGAAVVSKSNTAHSATSNDIKHSVIHKTEKPSSIALGHALLSTLIQQQGTSRQIHSTDLFKHEALPPERTKESSKTHIKNTSLSDRDQNDLLLLLRQQSKLNTHVPTVSNTDAYNVTNIVSNPQCLKLNPAYTCTSNKSQKTTNSSLVKNRPLETYSNNSNSSTGKYEDSSKANSTYSCIANKATTSSNPTLVKSYPVEARYKTCHSKLEGCKIKTMYDVPKEAYTKIVDCKTSKVKTILNMGVNVTPNITNVTNTLHQFNEQADKNKNNVPNDTPQTLDTSRQDWESVMDAILSHKTPSRGPNALDMVLKKTSFSDLRNQRISRPATATILNVPKDEKSTSVIEKQGSQLDKAPATAQHANLSLESIQQPLKPSDKLKKVSIVAPPRVVITKVQNCNKTEPPKNKPNQKITIKAQNAPSISQSCKVSEIPNKQASHSEIKTRSLLQPVKIDTSLIQIVKKSTCDERNKRVAVDTNRKQSIKGLIKEKDPFISGIPNSDYDLLEELMDDDLRKEIGELSSDEDLYQAPVAGSVKGAKTMSMNSKSNTVKETLPHHEKIPTVSQSSRDTIIKSNQIPLLKCHKNSKPEITKKPFTSTSNIINVGNSKPQVIGSDTVICPANISHQPASANVTSMQNTEPPPLVATNSISVVEASNVIIATVPQPAIQNVVLIGSDLVFDPYLSMQTQIQSGLCTVNQGPAYGPFSNVPNITLYQTTQFAAPVVNPVIIGNAMTMQTSNMSQNLENSSKSDNGLKQSDFDHQSQKKLHSIKQQEPQGDNICKQDQLRNGLEKQDLKIKVKHQEQINDNEHKRVDIRSTHDELNLDKYKDQKSKITKQLVNGLNQELPKILNSLEGQLNEDFKQESHETVEGNTRKGETHEARSNPHVNQELKQKVPTSDNDIPDQSKQPETKILDINLNKICERKVLSEVQEKQKIVDKTDNLKGKNKQIMIFNNVKEKQKEIECVTSEVQSHKENKLEKENAKNLERLQNKRLAIINREITHRSNYPPIPLSYVPLTRNTPNTGVITTETQQSAGLKIKRKINEETVVNNKNALDKEDKNQRNKRKENNNNSTQCRRILLRSSNESKANTDTPLQAESVIVKDDTVKSIKIRIKIPTKKHVAEDDSTVQGDSTNQEIKKAKGVSKKVRKNQVKAKKKAKTVTTVVSTKKCKKQKKTKILVNKDNSSIDMINIEDILPASSIPKTNNIPIDSKNIHVEASSSKNDIKNEEKLIHNEQRNISKSTHLDVQDFDNKGTGLKITKKVNTTQKSKSSDTIVSQKSAKIQYPNRRHITRNSSNNMDLDQSPLDSLPEKSSLIEEMTLKPNSVEVIKNTPITKNEVKNNATQKSNPANVRNATDISTVTHTAMSATSLPEKSSLIEEMTLKPNSVAVIKNTPITKNEVKNNTTQKSNSANVRNPTDINTVTHTAMSAKTTLQQKPRQANLNKPHSQTSTKLCQSLSEKQSSNTEIINNKNNTKQCQSLSEKQSITEIINNKQSQLPNVKPNSNPEIIKPLVTSMPQRCADVNNSQSNVNLPGENIDIMSLEKDVTIEELPPLDNEPNKKRLRIILPNGKVFKATVFGQMYVSFQSLFSDPSLKMALMNNLCDNKRYTLNVKQISTMARHDPNKVFQSRIEEISFQEKSPTKPVETVNLLSDDDDDVPVYDNKQKFKTEFGMYTVTMVDTKKFELHQKKFDLKSVVVLKRISIPSSDITDVENNETRVVENSPIIDLVEDCEKILEHAPLNSNDIVNEDTVLCNNSIAVQENNVTPSVLSDEVPLPLNEILSQGKLTCNSPIAFQNNSVLAPSVLINENEVIEIDDSSNDSMNLLDKYDPMSNQLENIVDANTATTSIVKDINPEEKIIELKNLLLQDLGVNDVENSVADIPINEETVENINENLPCPSECYVQLTRCDDIVKKYEHLKLMKRKYTVDLFRCDHMIKIANEDLTEEHNSDSEELIDVGSEEINLLTPSELSRCNSFSLLNDFSFYTGDTPNECLSINASYEDDRTSPVIDVYDTIVAFQNYYRTVPENKNQLRTCNINCYSEWLQTKHEMHIESKTYYTSYDSEASISSNVLIDKKLPSLKSLTANVFKYNNAVLDRYVNFNKTIPLSTFHRLKRKLKSIEPSNDMNNKSSKREFNTLNDRDNFKISTTCNSNESKVCNEENEENRTRFGIKFENCKNILEEKAIINCYDESKRDDTSNNENSIEPIKKYKDEIVSDHSKLSTNDTLNILNKTDAYDNTGIANESVTNTDNVINQSVDIKYLTAYPRSRKENINENLENFAPEVIGNFTSDTNKEDCKNLSGSVNLDFVNEISRNADTYEGATEAIGNFTSDMNKDDCKKICDSLNLDFANEISRNADTYDGATEAIGNFTSETKKEDSKYVCESVKLDFVNKLSHNADTYDGATEAIDNFTSETNKEDSKHVCESVNLDFVNEISRDSETYDGATIAIGNLTSDTNKEDCTNVCESVNLDFVNETFRDAETYDSATEAVGNFTSDTNKEDCKNACDSLNLDFVNEISCKTDTYDGATEAIGNLTSVTNKEDCKNICESVNLDFVNEISRKADTYNGATEAIGNLTSDTNKEDCTNVCESVNLDFVNETSRDAETYDGIGNFTSGTNKEDCKNACQSVSLDFVNVLSRNADTYDVATEAIGNFVSDTNKEDCTNVCESVNFDFVNETSQDAETYDGATEAIGNFTSDTNKEDCKNACESVDLDFVNELSQNADTYDVASEAIGNPISDTNKEDCKNICESVNLDFVNEKSRNADTYDGATVPIGNFKSDTDKKDCKNVCESVKLDFVNEISRNTDTYDGATEAIGNFTSETNKEDSTNVCESVNLDFVNEMSRDAETYDGATEAMDNFTSIGNFTSETNKEDSKNVCESVNLDFVNEMSRDAETYDGATEAIGNFTSDTNKEDCKNACESVNLDFMNEISLNADTYDVATEVIGNLTSETNKEDSKHVCESVNLDFVNEISRNTDTYDGATVAIGIITSDTNKEDCKKTCESVNLDFVNEISLNSDTHDVATEAIGDFTSDTNKEDCKKIFESENLYLNEIFCNADTYDADKSPLSEIETTCETTPFHCTSMCDISSTKCTGDCNCSITDDIPNIIDKTENTIENNDAYSNTENNEPPRHMDNKTNDSDAKSNSQNSNVNVCDDVKEPESIFNELENEKDNSSCCVVGNEPNEEMAKVDTYASSSNIQVICNSNEEALITYTTIHPLPKNCYNSFTTNDSDDIINRPNKCKNDTFQNQVSINPDSQVPAHLNSCDNLPIIKQESKLLNDKIYYDDNIIEIEIDDRMLNREDVNADNLLKCESKLISENIGIDEHDSDVESKNEYELTLNTVSSKIFDHIYVLKNEATGFENNHQNPTNAINELDNTTLQHQEALVDVQTKPEESMTELMHDSSKSHIRKEVTLVYKDGTDIVLKGIEYEDPVVGTCYVFPINKDTNDDDCEEVTEVVEQDNVRNLDSIEETESILQVNIPKMTYSRFINSKFKYTLKRKRGMHDVKVLEKKYRKGKNIDYPKITITASTNTAYCKEYKRILDYCSSLKFSFSRSFHKEIIEVDEIVKNWPITANSNILLTEIECEHILFQDNEEKETSVNPLDLSFIEEINETYNEPKERLDNVKETNFNMGFGEGSDRVNQNLEDIDDISKVSAATLSDVKQPQPFLLSENYERITENITLKQDQINKMKQYLSFIQLRDKVRSFFKQTTIELSYDWMKKDKNDKTFCSKYRKNYFTNYPFDLCRPDFIQPAPVETVVQVVQVGQLPVSAAAQNPVTCDPRVTQVSDISPSQCSVDNSLQDDSQVTIKTEYTELTTADLTLPLQDYAQHNQSVSLENQDQSNLSVSNENIPIETEISVVKIELMEELPEVKEETRENVENNQYDSVENKSLTNTEYTFDTNHSTVTNTTNTILQPDTDFQTIYDSQEKQSENETYTPHKQQNGAPEKTDQIAHAMNAAGITTTAETITNTTRAHALVNILSQKLRQGTIGTGQSVSNSFTKTTAINAMALQQALAQILPPPLNQTNSSENNQQANTQVTPQVLHIVQGKNASGSQITLVDNSQQSVISNQSATPVLHIVQNKTGPSIATSNGTATSQANTFSGLSLVDAGLQQGGNQLLHIVNTGSQKNSNATGQLLKRVNLLTNLTNVQGSNEQKMVQFVCKSADGKSIQLNAPHQRSMVLRLQPIESPNINVQTTPSKPVENQDMSPQANTSNSSPSKDNLASQHEIKSRSVYEENYAKFIQNSSNKSTISEKSTSLPKFNQAFGKPVFQEGNQKQNEISVNNGSEGECQSSDNAINIDHIGQISSPPLLLRKSPQTSQSQTNNLVQQLKQTIAPMNIQTMHGGVIYTRQIPVNIGGGQTINLITVPSTELIDESGQKQPGNQTEIEQSIIKIVPQTNSHTEISPEDGNAQISGSNETSNSQPQPVLTQMRIKLPMLSKNPQMVSGARVVRPSFFQIQRNVIGGTNQPVYQQLVLTAAPPLGQQTIRLPQTQTTRQIKVPTENQSSAESQMSSSTLEQLREFDMVLEQVKERSTVQPSSSTTTFPKLHTPSSDTTDGGTVASSTSTETTQQVLYSIGNNQPLNVAYVNRKATVTTPTTSTFARSPDSSGIIDSPTSTSHTQIPQTVTSDTTQSEHPTQSKPAKVSSKSKSRPKASSNPPNNLKLNTVPPKTSTQKPLEDEQTTQRILYILAEYKEQVENSPDKDKPAPRRRSNPPSNPSGSSKRKKSSSSSRRPGVRDLSPIHGEDTCRTMGSEDSSCGTSQGDCNESCLESHSPQDSPRKVVRKLTFEQETPSPQPRPQPQRNVIVADGQTITVARGTAGKPTTAVLMPANYILPVSMVKGGQQIAIVTNRGPKLLTVGGEGGATNALLLQRLIGPAGLKPVLARPGVRHVRLPTAALHNLQAFNLATATTIQPPDSTASPAPGPTPPELIDTRATSSPWTDREAQDVKPERASSPEGSEPWHLPSSGDPHDYSYEETVRADNLDRTVLVVQKKDGSSHRQHRLTHVSAAALRHKYAILEHELRLQKSLSEECEDLGVDSPSASELFPEAELLFAASPAHDHTQDQGHHSHTPQPTLLSQSGIPQPDIDDQIATDQLLSRDISDDQQDLNLGLEDVGIVTVSEDGMQATIALDQEEFARSHPNTTFHSEPTDEGVVQPFTIAGLKGRHITSTIFHSNRAPATVLMTAPQTTVISQATPESSGQNTVKYSDIDNMINSLPSGNTNNINLASVLVKEQGLTRFDNILSDSRELHLSNTASAIVHSAGNATQVIRRVCYDDDKRDTRFLMDEPDALIAGDDAKMIAEDSSRDATMESMAEDVDDDRSSPERHAELFWESNSASERSESRRPLDFSSDSEKCCKSPSYDETNSTDSSGVGTNMRLDSVIKDARGIERSGGADGSSADDTHPPLRTYPPKRLYHPLDGEMERSLSGKTRAGERSPDSLEVRRRASGRGVVKRGCHCCNGSPAPPRPKKSRQRKPTMDFTTN